MPLRALPTPVGLCCDRSQRSLVHRVATAGRWRQRQQLLLDVRGEVVQVHDLRHAGLGDVGEARQLGLVPHLPLAEHPVELDRQRHQSRHTGDSAWLHRVDAWGRVRRDLPSVVPPSEVQLAPNFNHAASSTCFPSSPSPSASDLIPVGWKATSMLLSAAS